MMAASKPGARVHNVPDLSLVSTPASSLMRRAGDVT